MKTLITFGIILLLNFPLQSQDCSIYLESQYDSITTVKDVYYGSAINFEGDTVDLYMDIFYPEFDTNTERPLLVAAHGGGFYTGSKIEGSIVKLCKKFAERGYVTASIDYRLGFFKEHLPGVGYFDQVYGYDKYELIRAIYRSVQDTRGAIRFLKGEADTYGIDTSNVFVGGESAGGFVALHTAYMKRPDEKPDAAFLQSNIIYSNLFGPFANFPRPDLGSIEGDLNLNGTSSNIKGVINIYGAIYDLNLIECGEPDLYQHHITEDIIVHCGAAKTFHQTPALLFPFTGNTKNPIVYGACSIRNYIRDSIDCCALKEMTNIIPFNLLLGNSPHNYCAGNSEDIFFEDAPLLLDSSICIVPLDIIDQNLTESICEGETTEIMVNAVGCNLEYQWYRDNQLISDANSMSYEASEAGDYHLEIIDCNGCLLSSLNILVEVIPLPEEPIIQINQDSILVNNGNNSLDYQWYFNGNPISDATDHFYIPTQSGNYSVQVTNDFGCQSESTPFNFVVTNSENLNLEQPIRIFPNPAITTLNIKIATPIDYGKIYNAQGKMIQMIEKDNHQIHLDHLNRGVYFLEIKSDHLTQVLKFVKL